MPDPYSPYPLKQVFVLGERVRVAAACGWRRDAVGVICSGPDPIETRQGDDFYYWVEFDAPEHDLSEDGPYRKAQILSRCIAREQPIQ